MRQTKRFLLIALLGLIVVLGAAVLISLSTKIPERRAIPLTLTGTLEAVCVPPAFDHTKYRIPSLQDETRIEVKSIADRGLLVKGYVRSSDGIGLANVRICEVTVRFDWNGWRYAVTDDDGYYAGVFQHIPGNESVTIWPEAEDLIFEPAAYSWTHPSGRRTYKLDFEAKPISQ